MVNYLLEKSRVVGPGEGERNFHIFYMVLKAAAKDTKDYLMLQEPSNYQYLSKSGCYEVGGMDDAAEYKEMMDAAKVVGFTDEHIWEIHRLISAILWLGNVSFKENKQEESQATNPDVLNAVAEILEVGYDDLHTALTTRQITTGQGARREQYVKPLKKSDAEFSRDTLSKSLYSKMFDWVVERVNVSIQKQNEEEKKEDDANQRVMGVLDIYGFEVFGVNSFEQICIN